MRRSKSSAVGISYAHGSSHGGRGGAGRGCANAVWGPRPGGDDGGGKEGGGRNAVADLLRRGGGVGGGGFASSSSSGALLSRGGESGFFVRPSTPSSSASSSLLGSLAIHREEEESDIHCNDPRPQDDDEEQEGKADASWLDRPASDRRICGSPNGRGRSEDDDRGEAKEATPASSSGALERADAYDGSSLIVDWGARDEGLDDGLLEEQGDDGDGSSVGARRQTQQQSQEQSQEQQHDGSSLIVGWSARDSLDESLL
ncbi:hypothetical protein ACHAWF_018584, partial [Thalassiosira exigua]